MRVDPFFPAISFDNDRTVQRIEFHNRSGNHVGRGNGVFQISVVIIQEVLPFPVSFRPPDDFFSVIDEVIFEKLDIHMWGAMFRDQFLYFSCMNIEPAQVDIIGRTTSPGKKYISRS